MNCYGDCPRCPLCPNIAQYDVEQLARHLSISHLMKNSGSILARIMMTSQIGHREVVAVLKDVRNLNEKFDDCAKFSRAKELENEDLELKMIQREAIKALEIEELKKTIEAKKISISKLSETETQTNKCKKESPNMVEQGEENVAILMEELKAVKDEKFKKDEEIGYWKLLALEHEAKAKSVVSEMKEQESVLKAINYKLVVEKNSDKIISAQLIESQKNVHEKEIQDFNLKLQNQINRSQGLKMRVKSLLEEVELLRADSWNKKDFVESMSNQVNSLKDVMKVAEENLDKKNAEIYLLKEKLATLESKVTKLDKDIEDFKHCFENYKEVSKDTITEKDKMLAFLEKELESTKAEYVEEFEKYSKKMSYEKTIADMKLKFGQYQETMGIMKDSLAGLTARHQDTSDQLRNVRKQFNGLENDLSSFCQDPVLSENNLVINNNAAVVKKEPQDMFSLGQGTSSIKENLGAQNMPLEFDKEGDEGKESQKSSDNESGRDERGRRSKKRKFTENI